MNHTAHEIYHGSDGKATSAFYAELQRLGPIGVVAVNLMRAQKCSARAKVYRGGIRGTGSYRSLAYGRKDWSLRNLCDALAQHAGELGLTWGWKHDPATPGYEWVLYVELPTGQCSFHAAVRYAGPDYAGEWDGMMGLSAERIIQFCEQVRHQRQAEPTLALTQTAS
jgi:hypothetical protein